MARARRSRSRKKRSASRKGGGIGLQASGLIAIGTFISILAVGMFLAQLRPLLKLQQVGEISIKAQDSEIANRLALQVASYSQAVRLLAQDPLTRELVLSRDSHALVQRETEMRRMFPGAWRVRILPELVHTPTEATEPYIGYACIDMMKDAVTSGKLPPAEVHVMGTPQQHVDIIAPIPGKSRGGIIGLIQVTLRTELLKQWLNAAYTGEGYVSLIQQVKDRADLMLAESGNTTKRTVAHTVQVPVPGTRWMVNLWLPDSIQVGIFNASFLLTFAVAALMIFLMIMLLWRSMSRAISSDATILSQMVINEVRGDRTHRYHLNMKEFKQVARQIEHTLQSPTMVREHDDDRASLTMADLQIDETHSAESGRVEDNIAVEELEDPGAYQQAAAFQQQTAAAQQPTASPQPVTPTPASPPPTQPPAEIFKAYDIRGIVGQTLTAGHMQLIGQALGSEAVSRGVTQIAFARDGRLSGGELGQALVKGLISTGVNVIDVGMVPTPVLYYAAAELTEGSGVMLTGSHNPANYNGVKIVLNGETLSGDAIQELKRRIDDNDFAQGQGEYKTNPVSNQYIERIVSDIKLPRPLKVVVDCGNGVAGGLAPKLYKALGCEVVELYSEVDGKFPNHHPDPSQPKNLQDLIEMVRSTNADVGLAFDGDGDRLGVVSPDGSIVWPDRLMMLFTKDVLSRNPGAQIIYDIKCSNNLTTAIWAQGGEPVMWKTGHSLIKSKMQQTGALLAGEMSGHIFFKERWYGFDDALYAGARLLEILASDGRTSREIFASLPDAVNTPELRVDLPQSELDNFMNELLARVDFPDATVIMIDGVRADFEDGWGLVRASNTTPSLIMRFEGRDKDALQRIQEAFRTLMLDVKPDLSLPF